MTRCDPDLPVQVPWSIESVGTDGKEWRGPSGDISPGNTKGGSECVVSVYQCKVVYQQQTFTGCEFSTGPRTNASGILFGPVKSLV